MAGVGSLWCGLPNAHYVHDNQLPCTAGRKQVALQPAPLLGKQTRQLLRAAPDSPSG